MDKKHTDASTAATADTPDGQVTSTTFDDVARMTYERAAERDPLLQVLLASPERTRQV
jgi:hypothetical protein